MTKIITDVIRAASDLKKIYGGDWASLLATFSTDEDFVEAYELLALSRYGPTAFGVTVTYLQLASTGKP